MPLIGYHTSSAGGYHKAAERAYDLELETFQFFLGSPRTWNYRDLKPKEVEKLTEKRKEYGYDVVTVHMNYLPNPSTPESDQELREKTRKSFLTEVERCHKLKVNYLIFHIGSHKGNGFDVAKPQVAKLINEALDLNPKTKLLLETSAGQTNSVGSKFEEIAEILELVNNKQKIGVCFDTCHVFAAGYDLRNEKSVDKTFEEFDNIIGLDKLNVVHANDSKGKLGQGKDRHAHIGEGYIGVSGFKAIINRPELKNLPVILETPSKSVKNDIMKLKDLRE